MYQAHLKTIGSASPVKLTPLGQEIATTLRVEQKIVDHWDAIKAKVEAKNPQNPYDIQVAAMTVARECFDGIFTEAEKSEVKAYAFAKGMNLLEIYPVIGIEVRNRILKERDIALDTIDQFAPPKRTA